MAIRKNTRFIDPRYFMDEKMERLDEDDKGREEGLIQAVLGNAQADSPDRAQPVVSVKKMMERELGREVDMDTWVQDYEPVKVGSHKEGWAEITVTTGPHGKALWLNRKSQGQSSGDPESAGSGLPGL